jgi:hypothetical protein
MLLSKLLPLRSISKKKICKMFKLNTKKFFEVFIFCLLSFFQKNKEKMVKNFVQNFGGGWPPCQTTTISLRILLNLLLLQSLVEWLQSILLNQLTHPHSYVFKTEIINEAPSKASSPTNLPPPPPPLSLSLSLWGSSSFKYLGLYPLH